MRENLNTNAAKSVGVVFVLSLAASLLSFVCEMLFAEYFGVSAETDAFTIASQIPVILFSVVTVSISTTVVPLYSHLLHNDGIEHAQQFVSKFITLIAIISVIFVAVCEIMAPAIVKLFAPGIVERTFIYAVKFSRLIFPTIIFTGLMSACLGVLQVHKKFGKSSVLAVIRQCVYAAFIISLHEHMGIGGAISGLLAASFIEFIMAAIFTTSEIGFRLDFHLRDSNIIEAVKMSCPIFAGIGAAEINRLVDKIVASFLKSGSISMLNYASKLSGAFTTLLIGAISTVMFPCFAEKVAKRDKDELSEVFFLTLELYLLLTIPISVGGMILRQKIVEIAFLRGAFTKNHAIVVSDLFAGYLLAMFFSALRQTGAKLFYAEGDTKTPMINTVIGICFNIVLNVVLGYYMGAMGLVYATVISTVIISMLLMISVHKFINVNQWKSFFIVFLKTIIASAGMASVLVFVLPMLEAWNKLISFLVLVGIGILVYGLLLLLVARKNIKDIIETVKNR